MSRSLQLAWLCGFIPLATGSSIYFAWTLTEWDWLMFAGVITIYVGVAAFAVGCIALARYCWLAMGNPSSSRLRVSVIACACGGLLLANFPAAGAILAAVVAKQTRYTLIIANDSSLPLMNVRVIGGGVDVSLPDIPPGGTASRRIWFDRDGHLDLSVKHGRQARAVEVEGYVTNCMGGGATVAVDDNGEFSVIHFADD